MDCLVLDRGRTFCAAAWLSFAEVFWWIWMIWGVPLPDPQTRDLDLAHGCLWFSPKPPLKWETKKKTTLQAA